MLRFTTSFSPRLLSTTIEGSYAIPNIPSAAAAPLFAGPCLSLPALLARSLVPSSSSLVYFSIARLVQALTMCTLR